MKADCGELICVAVTEEQLCCYRILNALYTLGTRSSTFVQRSVRCLVLKLLHFNI